MAGEEEKSMYVRRDLHGTEAAPAALTTIVEQALVHKGRLVKTVARAPEANVFETVLVSDAAPPVITITDFIDLAAAGSGYIEGTFEDYIIEIPAGYTVRVRNRAVAAGGTVYDASIGLYELRG